MSDPLSAVENIIITIIRLTHKWFYSTDNLCDSGWLLVTLQDFNKTTSVQNPSDDLPCS